MKKTLFLAVAFFSATASGWGAVSLLDGFTPSSLSSGNDQVNWNDSQSAYSEGWAVSFRLDIPGGITKNDSLFSLSNGDRPGRGYELTFMYGHNASAVGYTLQFGSNAGSGVFSQSISKSLLASSPLTLIVKQIEETSTSSVFLYVGDTQVATGTVGQLLSLTKGSSTFWSNGGRTQFSDIQGVVFDKTDSNMDVLAALGVVPEPATASMGLLGLAALLMRRRRA